MFRNILFPENVYKETDTIKCEDCQKVLHSILYSYKLYQDKGKKEEEKAAQKK